MNTFLTPRHHLPGFSLLELLVALVVLSMLMLLLASQFGFGARVWERTQGPGRMASHHAAVQSWLTTSLKHIYPAMTEAGAVSASRVDFRGTPAEMEFLSPPPHALGKAPFLRTRLTLTDDGTKLHLILSNDLRADPEGKKVEERDLLNDITNGSFSYYGPLPRSTERAWQDEWINRTALPELVRFQVSFSGLQRKKDRELIIRPRIDADVSCLYDRLTGKCRGR